MSVGQARRLCPRIILVGGDPAKYVAVARQVFDLLRASTPQVEVFSIDEAFLDVTGTYLRFGLTPGELARQIKRRLRAETGLTCSVGIGPNKLIAKVASELQKPDGLVHIQPADVPALMARLPVENLCGVGPRIKVALNLLGIVTCADLGHAPEPVLTGRFGIIGSLLKRMGQGVDETPVVSSVARPKSMGHAYTLPRDTRDRAVIMATLLRLSEYVAHRLRAEGARGRTVGLTVRYADFTGVSHERTMVHPIDDGGHIRSMTAVLFTQYCEPLRQAVRLLGVGVSNLVWGFQQPSFLDEEIRWDRLNRCADQINDRFGDSTIVRAGAFEPLIAKSHGFLIHPRRPRDSLILR